MSLPDVLTLLERPDTTIAVVGATVNPRKFGSVIYLDLRRKGYVVYPVNPHRDRVHGDRCYARVSDIDPPPTLIDFVVPPDVTLQVLGDCLEAGLLNVWLQPGSEDPATLRFLQENRFNYLAHACVMVETRRKGDPDDL